MTRAAYHYETTSDRVDLWRGPLGAWFRTNRIPAQRCPALRGWLDGIAVRVKDERVEVHW